MPIVLKLIFFIISIAYSHLYVASEILKSVPHKVKFILDNCHVVMSMDI